MQPTNTQQQNEQWEEVSGGGGTFVKFKSIGDSITGKIVGRRLGVKSKFGKDEDIFAFETTDGTPFQINASADLKSKLKAVADGATVRITFKELKDTGKGNPMKVFAVQVRQG